MPPRPYPGFPLFLHKTGQWAKKIRGRTRYFGTDWNAALAKFQEERDDLYAGREPRARQGTLTVADLVNHFLTERRARVQAGELTARCWTDYHRDAAVVAEVFGRDRPVAGLSPADFATLRAARAATLGPTALASFVQRVRTMFKYGFEAGLLDVPVRFGPSFSKPAARVVRGAKRAHRMLEAGDLRRLIDAAPVQLRAMILLGLNCGFGQTDCARLPRSAVRGVWIDFPRPKTGIPRRCPLWPETVKALAEVARTRRPPLNPADDALVFLTYFGRPWVRYHARADGGSQVDGIGAAFAELCKEAGATADRGFYVLRHTFRTVADRAGDQIAAGVIMGHLDNTIAGVYRGRIEDARLRKVAEYVRAWLFGKKRS